MTNPTYTDILNNDFTVAFDTAKGGIGAQAGTSILNLHQLIGANNDIMVFQFGSLVQPAAMLGYLPSSPSTGTLNIPTLVQRADGKLAICVDVTDASGSIVEAAPAAVSVGVASTAVLAANATRRHLVLVNTSANWMSISFNGAAVLNSGITLAPNGGAWEWTGISTLCPKTAVTAIAGGAASNLAVQEGN